MRQIHSILPPTARMAEVERQIEGVARVYATYSTVRGTEPRKHLVEVVGVAQSAVYGSDALIVRDGNGSLFYIPLTVLIYLEPAA